MFLILLQVAAGIIVTAIAVTAAAFILSAGFTACRAGLRNSRTNRNTNSDSKGDVEWM